MIDRIFDSPEIQKLKETFESVFHDKKRPMPMHQHHHKYYCCKCHQRLMNISKEEEETKLSIMLSFGKAFQNRVCIKDSENLVDDGHAELVAVSRSVDHGELHLFLAHPMHRLL